MAGLTADKVRDYWIQRIREHGPASTSLIRSSVRAAGRDYAMRRDFIFDGFPELPTLDYGCGAGAYSSMFCGPYLGVDICPQLIEAAQKAHPDKAFHLLEEPVLPIYPGEFNFQLVFTATVLQHNDDNAVRAILRSIRAHNSAPVWVLYENMEDNSPTVCGRTPMKYIEMIEQEGFPVGECKTGIHVMHKANHGLTVIYP